jgi:hypothetical protein
MHSCLRLLAVCAAAVAAMVVPAATLELEDNWYVVQMGSDGQVCRRSP